MDDILGKVPVRFRHLKQSSHMESNIGQMCTKVKQERRNIHSAMPVDYRVDSKLLHNDYNY